MSLIYFQKGLRNVAFAYSHDLRPLQDETGCLSSQPIATDRTLFYGDEMSLALESNLG